MYRTDQRCGLRAPALCIQTRILLRWFDPALWTPSGPSEKAFLSFGFRMSAAASKGVLEANSSKLRFFKAPLMHLTPLLHRQITEQLSRTYAH